MFVRARSTGLHRQVERGRRLRVRRVDRDAQQVLGHDLGVIQGKRPLEIVHRLRVLEVGHVLVRRTRRQQRGSENRNSSLLIFILFCYRFISLNTDHTDLTEKAGQETFGFLRLVFRLVFTRQVLIAQSLGHHLVDRAPVQEAAEVAVVDENVRLQLAGEVVVPVSPPPGSHGSPRRTPARARAEGQRLLQEPALTDRPQDQLMPIRLQFPQRLDGERKLTPDRRILVLDDRTVEIYRYYHLFNSQFSILNYKGPDHRTAGVVYVKVGSAYRPKPRGLLAARDGHCHPGDPTVSFLPLSNSRLTGAIPPPRRRAIHGSPPRETGDGQ